MGGRGFRLTSSIGSPRCALLSLPLMILRYLLIVCMYCPCVGSKPLTEVAPRMWTLTLICALFGSSSNLFFSLRYPSVFISPVIALVIVHPLGRAWDKLLKYEDDPVEAFDYGIREEPKDYGTRKSRLRLWLAQGKWNEKEHACVYIGSNVSFGFAFATDVSAPAMGGCEISKLSRLLSNKPNFIIKSSVSCIKFCLPSHPKFLDTHLQE